MNMDMPSETEELPKFKNQWNRLVLRLFDRRKWHAHGILCWFLRRSFLRYVPFPYPSVATPEQWQLQAEQMVQNRSLSRAHWQRAIKMNAFNGTNLKELHYIRGKVGLEWAFVEDSLLTGLLAARTSRYMPLVLRQAAVNDAD